MEKKGSVELHARNTSSGRVLEMFVCLFTCKYFIADQNEVRKYFSRMFILTEKLIRKENIF